MTTVYIENRPFVGDDYRITAEAVTNALSAIDHEFEIVVGDPALPDTDALARSKLFIGSGFDPQSVGKHGRRLEIIHCTSAGVERYLPLDWLPENAVLTNSSGVHAEKGGTFGAMAVLMLNEGVPRQFTNQRHSRWDGRLSTSIRGKTVLIYGFGSLGEAIADRLRPFGPRIAGVRRSGQAHPSADRMLRPDEIHAILPQVDILVVSCPLTRETRGRFGACELDLLPRGASVFNIARAAVMDYRALCDRLISGHISGAILDVFDEEPLPKESYLWDVPNLVISPHVSCDDAEGYIERCLGIFAKNVRNWMEKRPLINVVDSFREY